MALKQKITENIRLVGNVELSAYISVESITGGKGAMLADVRYTKDSKDGDLIKVCQFSFIPNMDGENFISQAYQHLKTLPEFFGAVDC